MRKRSEGQERIPKSIKLDADDLAVVEQIMSEEVRDFSEQIEYWVKEKVRAYRARIEIMRDDAKERITKRPGGKNLPGLAVLCAVLLPLVVR